MTSASRRLSAAWILLLIFPAAATAARPDSSIASERPDPASVQRYGPAYRYPRAGWIVLHVEGAPYERGYQHGRLLALEIADYVDTLAKKRSPKAPGDAWRANRTAANALFLRKFDSEYLEEMKGMADGASAGGAKFDGRPLDLIDLVAINAEIELDFLDSALDATATGLESKSFREPPDKPASAAPPEHCSSFAANGPATADGKIVIGHITMFTLYFVRHFNVWLDVKPDKGHRVLMQTYPGGIMSGMDYYMNDAGLVVTETTLDQTKFDATGDPLASRIRKALQYSESIDQVVDVLKTANNGMYTNEWLLADTKTNEIAMFELGTQKTKLWRSSKDEWIGGTKGFYWGCNNAKDLNVRLETVPGLEGKPANVVFHPSDRDRAWLKLYEKHKGTIGVDFGFEAFTTPPLAAFPSLDAKFTTSAMAKELKTWALFGPPLGKTWDPSDADRRQFPEAQPLVSNDWTVLTADAVGPLDQPKVAPAVGGAFNARPEERDHVSIRQVSLEPVAPVAVDLPSFKETASSLSNPRAVHPAAWHGTLLPKSDADVWLASAFADYQAVVAAELARKSKSKEHASTKERKDATAVALFGPYSRYSTAVKRLGKDVPLVETKSDLTRDEWYGIASGKGVLFLAALRKKLGDETFLKLMDDFGRAHAGNETSTAEFRAEVERLGDDGLKELCETWLTRTGLPGTWKAGHWSVNSYEAELDRTVIVYGTVKESDAQREAAYRLQRQIERKWANITVPVIADKETFGKALHGRHVLLVGRPDTNSFASGVANALPISFGPASFVLRGETFANPKSAVIVAGPKSGDPRCEVVLFAGLSAEATWRCVMAVGQRDEIASEAILLPAGAKPRPLVVSENEPDDVKLASDRVLDGEPRRVLSADDANSRR